MPISLVDQAGATVSLATDKPAGLDHRPVHHSEAVTLQITKTRPADVVAYAAGDVIGALADVVFAFDLNALGLTRGGLIVGARLIRQSTANTATRFRAAVHNAVPGTLTNADNAAHPLLWANRPSRRGWIDFTSPQAGDAAGSDCLEYAGVLSNVQGIVADPADGIVRVLLTTRDVVTLGSAEALTLELDLVL